MTDICQERFARKGKGCPHRARFIVVCVGWTMRMCGVHTKPYQHDMRMAHVGFVARGSAVLSITPIDSMDAPAQAADALGHMEERREEARTRNRAPAPDSHERARDAQAGEQGGHLRSARPQRQRDRDVRPGSLMKPPRRMIERLIRSV